MQLKIKNTNIMKNRKGIIKISTSLIKDLDINHLLHLINYETNTL